MGGKPSTLGITGYCYWRFSREKDREMKHLKVAREQIKRGARFITNSYIAMQIQYKLTFNYAMFQNQHFSLFIGISLCQNNL